MGMGMWGGWRGGKGFLFYCLVKSIVDNNSFLCLYGNGVAARKRVGVVTGVDRFHVYQNAKLL